MPKDQKKYYKATYKQNAKEQKKYYKTNHQKCQRTRRSTKDNSPEMPKDKKYQKQFIGKTLKNKRNTTTIHRTKEIPQDNSLANTKGPEEIAQGNLPAKWPEEIPQGNLPAKCRRPEEISQDNSLENAEGTRRNSTSQREILKKEKKGSIKLSKEATTRQFTSKGPEEIPQDNLPANAKQLTRNAKGPEEIPRRNTARQFTSKMPKIRKNTARHFYFITKRNKPINNKKKNNFIFT
ncbi:hypothetical protein F8M41_003562 [Gigaspora margarita]|uniref:Uncharacterized protein n=1 Tax=Gigaspora margarita TaxID=4874 RepID=A0A8H4AXY1_GIGMA|nr:hypothetical protein F8M41_003562 [Gigaspora margarita]